MKLLRLFGRYLVRNIGAGLDSINQYLTDKTLKRIVLEFVEPLIFSYGVFGLLFNIELKAIFAVVLFFWSCIQLSILCLIFLSNVDSILDLYHFVLDSIVFSWLGVYIYFLVFVGVKKPVHLFLWEVFYTYLIILFVSFVILIIWASFTDAYRKYWWEVRKK